MMINFQENQKFHYSNGDTNIYIFKIIDIKRRKFRKYLKDT